MTRYVAFLRAINVGGHTVTMATLAACFESLGLANVSTFIASGNVIFATATENAAALERSIASRLRTELGYDVDTFLRTDVEVAAISSHRAFPAARVAAAGALNVGLLATPLGAAGRKAMLALRTDVDDFHVHGREIYWLCQTKQSQSTFSNAVLERRLGVRSTWRSVNTMQRLAKKFPPASGGT